jgi:hypothetical protein
MSGHAAGGEPAEGWIREVWLQAAGRGGRDAAEARIHNFQCYAASRWGKERLEWESRQRADREKREGAAKGVPDGVAPAEFPWRKVAVAKKNWLAPTGMWEEIGPKDRRILSEIWAHMSAEERVTLEAMPEPEGMKV